MKPSPIHVVNVISLLVWTLYYIQRGLRHLWRFVLEAGRSPVLHPWPSLAWPWVWPSSQPKAKTYGVWYDRVQYSEVTKQKYLYSPRHWKYFQNLCGFWTTPEQGNPFGRHDLYHTNRNMFYGERSSWCKNSSFKALWCRWGRYGEWSFLFLVQRTGEKR